ncbi:MAG TPA: class I SAM-dependent methyltransferase [Candidatus Eisenbacteria bacterium]|nr:class I SAM-dependent methyltransferase [Candidatus Eisenbacteria bacterium]
MITASDPSRERWNRRWAGEERVHASTAPSRFVVAEVADLPPGAALDLACGAGRNAVWLAERGWRVTAVDFSGVALRMARSLEAERRVAVEWVEADVLAWTPPPRAYDLVCVLYLQLPAGERRTALARAAAAVRPGGTLLVLGHDLLNLTDGWGGPTQADVLFTPDDVVAEIGDLRIEKAERVRRAVDDPGASREAIDALVRATRVS